MAQLPPLLLAGLLAAGGTLLPPGAMGGAAASGDSAPIGEALRPSNADQQALCNWLRQKGAVFYGAWWCPACFQQKNLFGQEAGNRLPYVECDRDAAGRSRCQEAAVRVFPTWVLNGQRREGVQSLEELKSWSGFPAAAAGAHAGQGHP
jgi:glutaredoxin